MVITCEYEKMEAAGGIDAVAPVAGVVAVVAAVAVVV